MKNSLTTLEVSYTNEMQTLVKQTDLNPWWIAGITAGEGSFMIIHSDFNFTAKFSIVLTTTNQHFSIFILIFMAYIYHIYLFMLINFNSPSLQ
jgi:hypothetical protein